MQLFLFSLKMSITAILFYWRNDTPSFVTWWSRLATAPDAPTRIVIHGGQFTGGVHPPNQFVPEIVSPLPCSPATCSSFITDCLFFKEHMSFIGSLDKCHTSVFNALIIENIYNRHIVLLAQRYTSLCDLMNWPPLYIPCITGRSIRGCNQSSDLTEFIPKSLCP